MKTSVVVGVVCLQLLVASLVGANSAEEVYRESGLEYELGQLGDAMVSQFSVGAASPLYDGVTEDDFYTIVQTVPFAFSERAMRAGIIEAIEEELTASQRSNILAWLRSPAGLYMTELEGISSAPEAIEQLNDFIAANEREALSSDRLALLARLDKAAGVTEGAVDLAIGVQLGMVAGALATVPMDQEARQSQMSIISSQLEASRAQIIQQMEEQIAASIAFTYANADDQQLAAYVEFLESDLGVRYSNVVSEALEDALLDASIRFGRLLAERLGTDAQTL